MTADRDAELRALLALHPGDPATVLVYADWLEERGELACAQFLRKQEQLRALPLADPALLDAGRVLHELGKTVPAAWLAAITNPAVEGTAWKGEERHGGQPAAADDSDDGDDGSVVWRFLPGGVLNYTQSTGTYENGTWVQIGATIAMETNAHYADYFGVILGAQMRGDAHNVVDARWAWSVEYTEDPKITAMPANVVRRIHDDWIKARQRKPKRERVAKPRKAAAKPLQRTTRLATRKPLQRTTKLATRKPIERAAKPRKAVAKPVQRTTKRATPKPRPEPGKPRRTQPIRARQPIRAKPSIRAKQPMRAKPKSKRPPNRR